MFIEATVLGACAALARGGSLKRLSDLQFRGITILTIAMALQGVVRFGLVGDGFGKTLYSLSFILLWVGTLANLPYRGMPMISIGILLNGLVIMVNGGKMPVVLGRSAADNAPRYAAQLTTHLLASRGYHLQFLGDIIRIWTPLNGRIIISVGDIFLGVGLAVLTYNVVAGHATTQPRHP